MSVQSRHSVRTLCTKRSANALAFREHLLQVTKLRDEFAILDGDG
jgi:hypothetical protein